MIDFTKNKAKITFNNSIYYPEILGTATSDFKKSCKIRYINEGLYSSVVIESKDELRPLTLEFCNYALALMKDKFVELAHYVKNE
ncbi:MAG: HxsD-like protein [Nanoarchaeota archaeon]